MPTTHQLPASAKTVHWGFFDAALPPVLTIASGDTIEVTTVSGGKDSLPKPGLGMDVLPEHLDVLAHHSRVGPHIMTGPVFVEGAEIGDTLEVRIQTIELRQNWGYNVIRPLGGTIPEDFGETILQRPIPIDMARNVAKFPWGGEMPLAPFFGNIGVAPPPAYGRQTSAIPREFAGNLDIKELVAGSTLFLPVFNSGALLSIGDGHGAQGDGEVCQTALETALGGTFEVVLHKGKKLRLPRAETPTHFLTMAFDVDLDDAAKEAVREMIAWLVEMKGISREDAYTFMSLACDVRISQLVNGNKGVHAMAPKAVLDTF
jgi:acetamidase/formamidase